MADRFQEVFQLVFESLGEDKARELEKILRQVGDAGGAADDQLTPLVDELRKIGEQKQAVKTFEDLSARQKELAKSAQEAGLKLKLATEQEQASVATLRERSTALDKAKAAQREYAQSADKTAQGTRKLRDAVRDAANAQKTANAQLKDAKRTLDAATRDYDKLGNAQDRLTGQLKTASGELKAAGIATDKLGEAQADLGRRGTQAAQGLQKIATSLRAEQQAARELAQAHKTLGTRPFGDIETEISKVRQAYDKLAKSGTLSGKALAQANARMSERVRDLRSQTNGWVQSLDKVKLAAAPAAASLFALQRVLSSSTRVSSEFATSVAQISTLLDDTSGIPQITQQLKDLSAQFGGSAKDQAQAFYDVLSAGYEDAADAANVLDTSNRLAIGGVTDLGTATSGLVSVLKAYGLASSQATRVADAYFIAAKGGATSVKELAESVGQVAPQAAVAKIPVEDLTAAIGALTNGGIKTADAVTQISSVLQAVIKPTEQAKKKAKELGIEFNLAALQSKGLQQFLTDLKDKTKGNTEDLATLIGRVEGLRGALALTGPLAKDFNKILGDMQGSAGATAEAFDKLKDTPEQRMRRFQGSLEQVQIALGNSVTAAAPLLDGLTGLLNAFNALPEGIKSSLIGLTALTAGMTAFRALSTQLGPSLKLLVSNFGAAGPAAAAAAKDVGALRRALSALPGALTIAVAVVGVLEATGAIDALSEAIVRLSGVQAQTRKTLDEARDSLIKTGDRVAAVAERYREFANQQVLSAEAAAKLGASERESYKARLDGLNKYLQAQVLYLTNESKLRDLSREERARLSDLQAQLKAAKAGYDSLAQGAQLAASVLQDELTVGAAAAVQSLGDVGKSSKVAADGIRAAFAGLDLRDAVKTGDLALALQHIGEESSKAGQAIRSGLRAQLAKLSGEDLLRFQAAAQAAFDETGRGAAQSSVILDETLHAALQALKVDAVRAGVQFTETGKQAIAAFTAIAENATASGQQVGAAFDAALANTRTVQEAERLGNVLQTAMEQGRIGAQRAALAMQNLDNRIRQLKAQTDPLASSFERLGIKSQSALDAAAKAARTAFQEIVNGARQGNAAQEDVQRAFDAYAAAARAAAKDSSDAAKAQVEASLKAQAAALGVKDSTEQAGQAGDKAGKQISAGMDTAAKSAKSAAEETGKVGDAAEDSAKQATSAAAAIASALNEWHKYFADISTGATAAFQRIADGVARSSVTVGDYLINLGNAATRLKGDIADQRSELDALTARYVEFGKKGADAFAGTGQAAQFTEANLQRMVAQIDAGTSSFTLLGKEDLGRLRAAAQAAIDKVRQLKDAARQADQQLKDLGASLKDQLDQINGNQEAIENRRFKKQLQQIKDLAQAAGEINGEAYRTAMENARELHEANLRNIRQEADARNDSFQQDQRSQRNYGNGGYRGGGGGGSGSGGSSGGGSGGGLGPINITLNSTVTDPKTLTKFARAIKQELDAIARRSR